ncbi:YD repeat-containing protein [Leucobacter luti]|uniref:hypothetical protein n=1 Tax=Leucobacter luti TaxID=340320 RepID=UPI0010446E70|nr:hypothetical protein [Leucobacter luti]MCW2287041.1 hypothetical protein [Leucobacter luti]TCK41266.1 YD repeat-containing protein [Leucobacter luti]
MGGWQQDELELALKLGVSPRRLSGWEPVTATTYEYDDDGRLVGSVTEREPEWSRADVEALVAHLERGRVGPHGQPMSEVTSELANPANKDRGWDYEVDVYTDFAQQKLSREQEAFKKAYGDDADMSSLQWIVRKVDRASAIG